MTTFETLIENSYKFPFCFTVAKCRDDRKMIWVNDKFFELTGYSKEEAIGRNCNFLQGEHTDCDHITNIRESFLKEHVVFQDILNYKKNKQMFVNRLIILPIKFRGEKYFIGMQNEIRQIDSLDELKKIKFLSYKDIDLDQSDIAHYVNNPLAIFVASQNRSFQDRELYALERLNNFLMRINSKEYPKI